MFQAQIIAQEFIVAVRPLVEAIELRDRNLADQLRRAATSAALNVAEGNRRDGRDRAARFRIASGECAEAVAALHIAVAWAYVADDAIADALGFADRLCAVLWRLRHPRR
jgi:four helix bundle protein